MWFRSLQVEHDPERTDKYILWDTRVPCTWALDQSRIHKDSRLVDTGCLALWDDDRSTSILWWEYERNVPQDLAGWTSVSGGCITRGPKSAERGKWGLDKEKGKSHAPIHSFSHAIQTKDWAIRDPKRSRAILSLPVSIGVYWTKRSSNRLTSPQSNLPMTPKTLMMNSPQRHLKSPWWMTHTCRVRCKSNLPDLLIILPTNTWQKVIRAPRSSTDPLLGKKKEISNHPYFSSWPPPLFFDVYTILI